MIVLICIAVGSMLGGYLAGRRDARHTRVKWHDPRLGSIGETASVPPLLETQPDATMWTSAVKKRQTESTGSAPPPWRTAVPFDGRVSITAASDRYRGSTTNRQ